MAEPNWGITGHEAAVRLLSRQLSAGTARQAYLFVGPEGSGKMTLARRFAAALNCLNDDPPCGVCRQCQRIERGVHVDIEVVGLASDPNSAEGRLRKNIGIGQVQALQHTLSLQPVEGRTRIAIIDGAELLTTEASNALLKTLEEPPDRAALILLAENTASLLPTVLSRCQRLDLRPVGAAAIEDMLVQQYQAAPEDARLFAALSGGRPGWAITALSDESIRTQRADRIAAIGAALGEPLTARLNRANQLATRFSASREEVYDTLDVWTAVLRDSLAIAAGAPDVLVNIDAIDTATSIARASDVPALRAAIQAIRQCKRHLAQNVNARLAIEAALARLPAA